MIKFPDRLTVYNNRCIFRGLFESVPAILKQVLITKIGGCCLNVRIISNLMRMFRYDFHEVYDFVIIVILQSYIV